MADTRGARLRLRTPAALCTLALLGSACATGSTARRAGDGSEGHPSRPSVRVSFSQLPIQVGSEQGLLRVTNTGSADLVVDAVGLQWAGLAEELRHPEDSALAPGRTVDFPVSLPRPDCGNASGPLVGVVYSGGATVREEIDEPGEELLRRKRESACVVEFVRERVGLEYGSSWRHVGAGAASSMLGHLRLVRRDGAEAVRVVHVEGSVIFDLELPGRSTLSPRTSAARIPLRVSMANRCDHHSLADVTAPFAFRATLRIGEKDADVAVTPPPAVRARLPELIPRACG